MSLDHVSHSLASYNVCESLHGDAVLYSVAAITIAAGPASDVVAVQTNENGERKCPPFKKGT